MVFAFLKKFFSKEEEVKVDEIKLEDLEKWFKDKAEKIYLDLDASIRDITQAVNEGITETKDNLAFLSTAGLHNPNITTREKQFMEGNRKAYILGVNAFLRGIDLEKKDYHSWIVFCDSFDRKLVEFGKSTFRSYRILQEFFANESRNIAINIKNLEAKVKGLKNTILAARIDKIDEMDTEIEDLKSKIKQREELENLLRNKENSRKDLLDKRNNLESELANLLKSEAHLKLKDLKVDREVVLSAIREHNSKLIHAFSVMERPLKKLLRILLEESHLLERYIENPVITLVSDKELKILGILRKLEDNLNNLTLELKDKKREKVLEVIQSLDEDFFRNFVEKHKELEDKLSGLENDISINESLKKEKRLSEELESLNEKIKAIGKEIDSTRKDFEGINIEDMKNKLEKEITGLLKTNVVIC